ncbi:MAG: hypothetical protein M3542_03330 [Acidobacteriota bacterium]|nr:hypothetical protein [Acidobacteriota bacterium]MDQ5870802.1 hypothetical protein [Acidobacteriota bacterium]
MSRFGRFFLLLCIAISPAAGRGQEPSPTPTPAPSPEQPSAPVEAPPPEATPPPEPEDVPSPAPSGGVSPSATYFNPAIAVIGNFLAVTGKNEVEDSPALAMRESEISLQAVVDPFAKADFFVAISNEGVELEEGFVTFTSLPGDLLVKVGKFKAQIGKVNLLHTHVLPWTDVPLPIVNLLGGEEGWNDAGVSIARIFPFGDTFSELTLQVFRGESEGLFEAPSRSDLAYLAHYRAYRDFGDDHNLELGSTWGRGSNGSDDDAKTTLENIHLVYRWKPLSGRPYRSFILRSELFRSRREQPDGQQSSRGFFVGGDYQLARRWFAGARYEFSDRADHDTLRDRGEAVTLTFWPSEFSQIRGELRRRRYAGGITASEAFLQLQFSIGAHGAHSF